jgi:uncharacterized protein (TIGR02246 family)
VDRRNDDAAIRAVEEAYDAAWNRADAPALVAAFAPDAIVVNPRGAVAVGKAEFERVIANVLAGAFRGSTHASRISRIHYPVDGVAVVDGEASIRTETETTVHRFTDVMVRVDGRWWITDVRAYVFLPE